MKAPDCQYCTLPIRENEAAREVVGRHYHEDLATCVGRLREDRAYWRAIAVAYHPEKEEVTP